ncbi:MAG: cytochrome c biogenesis heme-transporting ATPase CcmA [Gammaproteobacteria bacterium]|jgi:heme exporter protein A|nr:cytochrome c biogenesis heme-transporting ATPase CcmA [Gammaproteobacteria bacterium]MBT3724595.1 cytochrome c biogenesis heme-transporting ATPase CcmA [Gammaproteobacteria bacterium]MBT4077984.1 cytochrome c biogenesis heme-transporting ATPase CcmA [Gammaproteobacteria bacterium]MBT4194390.1 cytochrome c biogenesis heme-transporting ATPase CcmA [Gammaproteobacteria bacterium]MBT4450750.1 cytochrome c biogenesis heme-transporting ATPase CcmA [Gammaproteobacteria bacterium]
MSALLQTSDLTCVKDDRVLFEDLNISLSAGQMLLVEGKNGSGKTSLLRILTGLNLPESGYVLWKGEPIDKVGPDYYEQVNYIGHHDGIKRDLTCLENLRLVQAMGKPLPIDLDDALDKVNLYRFGDNFVATLSAGQKRRLAMARLVVTEAKLWIMDEPFTSLDKASMAMFQQMFEQHLANGGVIVMTSHHDIEMPDSDVVRLNLSE